MIGSWEILERKREKVTVPEKNWRREGVQMVEEK
jgi:hypothetical protein